jgi:hypothetical protein
MVLPSEHQIGKRESLVRGAKETHRELVARREHELEVSDHLLRPPFIGSSKLRLGRASGGQKLRESKAAKVLGQAHIHGRGLVQLGYRAGHIVAGAHLEEAGES